MIHKWANENLERLNCENLGMYIRNDIIPNIYATCLEENYDSGDKSLSQEDFLNYLNLRMFPI